MRTQKAPCKNYVLPRDKRRNIGKKKGVVLTRVHYYIVFLFSFTLYTESLKLTSFSPVP